MCKQPWPTHPHIVVVFFTITFPHLTSKYPSWGRCSRTHELQLDYVELVGTQIIYITIVIQRGFPPGKEKIQLPQQLVGKNERVTWPREEENVHPLAATHHWLVFPIIEVISQSAFLTKIIEEKAIHTSSLSPRPTSVKGTRLLEFQPLPLRFTHSFKIYFRIRHHRSLFGYFYALAQYGGHSCKRLMQNYSANTRTGRDDITVTKLNIGVRWRRGKNRKPKWFVCLCRTYVKRIIQHDE